MLRIPFELTVRVGEFRVVPHGGAIEPSIVQDIP